eukprot:787802-Pyramimonas_sp.AAC.1
MEILRQRRPLRERLRREGEALRTGPIEEYQTNKVPNTYVTGPTQRASATTGSSQKARVTTGPPPTD